MATHPGPLLLRAEDVAQRLSETTTATAGQVETRPGSGGSWWKEHPDDDGDLVSDVPIEKALHRCVLVYATASATTGRVLERFGVGGSVYDRPERSVKPVNEVPIARDHGPFRLYEENRRSALSSTSTATTAETKYEALLMVTHMWRAQFSVMEDLMEDAKEVAQDPLRRATDWQVFREWLDEWLAESKTLQEFAEQQNALVEEIGTERAEEILASAVVPRIEAIQDQARQTLDERPEVAETGMAADLSEIAVENQGVSAMPDQIEVVETDRVRVQRLNSTQREVYGTQDDYFFHLLHPDQGRQGYRLLGLLTEEALSEKLTDQFEHPVHIGVDVAGAGAMYYAYQGRYFESNAPPSQRTFELIRERSDGPQEEARIRAFVEQNLPAPRSQLERYIHWAREGDGVASFTDVIQEIETALLIADEEDTEAERDRMAHIVENARSTRLLNQTEYAECMQALGKQLPRRAAIPETVRHAVWRRDEGRCTQCGSQLNLEFDHIVPFSEGGSSTERNIQLLCEACNRSKGARI